MTFRIAIACICLAAAAAHAQDVTRPAKPGDVHVYVTQQKADRVTFEETVTIKAIEGDRIRATHVRSDRPTPTEGIYGKDWGTYQSGTNQMRLDPPSRVLSLPLAVGKTWDATYEASLPNGVKVRIKNESKVAAEEKLTTPAGEFQTFRVESEGYLSGLSFVGGWAFRQKVWYAPAIDRIVRTDYRELRSNGADNVTELKQFKPVD